MKEMKAVEMRKKPRPHDVRSQHMSHLSSSTRQEQKEIEMRKKSRPNDVQNQHLTTYELN